MKKVFALLASIMISISLVGCNSGGGSNSNQDAGTQISSKGSAITDEDRQAAAAYIGSTEYGELSEYVNTCLDGVVELADKGDVTELQARAGKMTEMITAMESLDVPGTCSDLHAALLQLARAESVALVDFSEVAIARSVGDDDVAAKSLEEANEYLDLAKQFSADYNEAMDELIELFS